MSPTPPPILPVSNRPRFVPPSSKAELTVRWAKLKRRLGNASLPDDSLAETGGTATGTDSSENGSTYHGAGGHVRRSSWCGGNAGKNTAGGGRSTGALNEKEEEEGVDEVVVDTKVWGQRKAGGTLLSSKHGATAAGTTGADTNDNTPTITRGGSDPDDASTRITKFEHYGPLGTLGAFFRWRVWPTIMYFFWPIYHDPPFEEAYQKENWFTGKNTVIFGACFLVFNWVLLIALLPHPWSLWNKIQNYGLGPLLSLPLVPMAALDVPRRQPRIWQIAVFLSVWISALGNIIDMNLCNYYTPERECGGRDFLATMYYVSALPIIALFALGQARAYITLGMIIWVVTVSSTILVEHYSFIRNVLNVMLFQGFILFTHYRNEIADRRMYTMRAELKVQFRAKQKAQISERKTMDAKRRFSSYIFHEVRVPLNTALLAVQNLDGANVFDKSSEHGVEWTALEGSLSMMSQVLNDVLDFSRMEKGGFTSVSRPFSFHSVMRSIFVPLRLDANARGLKLETILDHRIDEIANKAAYGPEEEDEMLAEGDGFVMGDEMRLRQVINNLASNACKFTSAGGKVSIRTSLIYPTGMESPRSSPDSAESPGCTSSKSDGGLNITSLPSGTSTDFTTSSTKKSPAQLSAGNVQQLEEKSDEPSVKDNMVVVRIEVTDSGVGIRAKDMTENRLFSAYVQTTIGKIQGGKGTGLGLSLVRQIVLLSGGRLGVKSRAGVGSTFWVEMPYGMGPQTRLADHEPHRRFNSKMEKELRTPSSCEESGDIPGEYRFLPSVGNEIGEQPQSILEALPTAYRFSPPPSPTIGHRAVISLNPIPIPSSSEFNLVPCTLIRPDMPTHLSVSSAPPLASVANPIPNPKAIHFAHGPLRVLVVDDDALTRRLMARMMTRLGCEVSTAENGAIALEMLLKTDGVVAEDGIDPRAGENGIRNFDITFLDNQMPVCTGLQVAAKLRSLARDDLVIGVTANALLSDQQEYLDQGASFVLTKPVLELDLKRFLHIADQRRSDSSGSPQKFPTRLLPIP